MLWKQNHASMIGRVVQTQSGKCNDESNVSLRSSISPISFPSKLLYCNYECWYCRWRARVVVKWHMDRILRAIQEMQVTLVSLRYEIHCARLHQWYAMRWQCCFYTGKGSPMTLTGNDGGDDNTESLEGGSGISKHVNYLGLIDRGPSCSRSSINRDCTSMKWNTM